MPDVPQDDRDESHSEHIPQASEAHLFLVVTNISYLLILYISYLQIIEQQQEVCAAELAEYEAEFGNERLVGTGREVSSFFSVFPITGNGSLPLFLL